MYEYVDVNLFFHNEKKGQLWNGKFIGMVPLTTHSLGGKPKFLGCNRSQKTKMDVLKDNNQKMSDRCLLHLTEMFQIVKISFSCYRFSSTLLSGYSPITQGKLKTNQIETKT